MKIKNTDCDTIKDLWELSIAVKEGAPLAHPHEAGRDILEVWHQAHALKTEVVRLREEAAKAVLLSPAQAARIADWLEWGRDQYSETGSDQRNRERLAQLAKLVRPGSPGHDWVCDNCGSNELSFEGSTHWDTERQQWIQTEVTHIDCSHCGAEDGGTSTTLIAL